MFTKKDVIYSFRYICKYNIYVIQVQKLCNNKMPVHCPWARLSWARLSWALLGSVSCIQAERYNRFPIPYLILRTHDSNIPSTRNSKCNKLCVSIRSCNQRYHASTGMTGGASALSWRAAKQNRVMTTKN